MRKRWELEAEMAELAAKLSTIEADLIAAEKTLEHYVEYFAHLESDGKKAKQTLTLLKTNKEKRK